MLIKILIVLSILLILTSTTYESFDNNEVLTLEKTKVYDIKNWKRLPNNTLINYVSIKAKTGKIDSENLMSIPQFGFPSLSGGNGYSNINKLQGTDGWQYDYEARHGNKWFWWQIENKNEKEIKIKIILTGNSSAPEFPVSYSVRVPDKYNKILTRFWIIFTHNPFTTFVKNSISLPLILDRKNITIEKDMWIKLRNKNTVDIPINAIQGVIDTYNITDTQTDWFSWKLSNFEQQGPKRIIISAELNNNINPPNNFPVSYAIKVKDKNYDNYVNYIITII